MRIVAKAGVRVGREGGLTVGRNTRAAVVGCAAGAIILDRNPVDGPFAGGIARFADGEVQVIRAGEVSAPNMVRRVGDRVHVDREHVGEPAVGGRVVVAARVGDEGTEGQRRADDLRRISEERVEIRRTFDRAARRVVDLHHVVDDLHFNAVADAESLVWRLQRKLPGAVGQALVTMVEAIEGAQDLQRPAAADPLARGNRNHRDRGSGVLDRAAPIDIVCPTAGGARVLAQPRAEFRLLDPAAATTCHGVERCHPRGRNISSPGAGGNARRCYCDRRRDHREDGRRRHKTMSEHASLLLLKWVSACVGAFGDHPRGRPEQRQRFVSSC